MMRFNVALRIALSALAILTGELAGEAPVRGAQAESLPQVPTQSATDKVELIFGETRMLVERSALAGVPHSTSHAATSWSDVSQWVVAPDQSVFIKLPEARRGPLSLRCAQPAGGAIILGRSAVLSHRDPNSFVQRDNLQPVATKYPGVSELVSPSRRQQVRDLYQFEDERLRNYWGDLQIFVLRNRDRPSRDALVRIQLTREMVITGSFDADDCFFSEGADIIFALRAYVRAMVVAE